VKLTGKGLDITLVHVAVNFAPAIVDAFLDLFNVKLLKGTVLFHNQHSKNPLCIYKTILPNFSQIHNIYLKRWWPETNPKGIFRQWQSDPRAIYNPEL